MAVPPDNQITWGNVLHQATRHVENRAATALRMAATSLWPSKTYWELEKDQPTRRQIKEVVETEEGLVEPIECSAAEAGRCPHRAVASRS
jgi:hypothetical protein